MMEQSSFVMLDNNDVIELDGYGKTIYQNNQETYFRGYRNRQEKDSGVGETKIVNATGELSSLIGMRCPYAVNFLIILCNKQKIVNKIHLYIIKE